MALVTKLALLAQLVEQGTFNPKVEGSTPSGRTSKHAGQGASRSGLLCYVLHHVLQMCFTDWRGIEKTLLVESRARPTHPTPHPLPARTTQIQQPIRRETD